MSKMALFIYGKSPVFRESSIGRCLIPSCIMDLFNSVYTLGVFNSSYQYITPSISKPIITMVMFSVTMFIRGFLLAIQLWPLKVLASQ